MNKKQTRKIENRYDSILHRTACILLIVVMFLISWSISEVYAKYVTSDQANNSANVAGVGIEIFNFREYGKNVADIDYSKVIPGVDIAAPHIQLKINSEVSYTLYLKVTVRNCPIYIDIDGEKVRVVYFDMTNDWEFVNKSVELDGYTIITYKYIVDTTDNVNNYVFKAGEKYTYVDDDEISILIDDVIYVSELYRNSRDGAFSIKFEAYMQQTL